MSQAETTNNENTVTLEKPLKRGDQVITAVTVIPPADSGALRGTRITELMQMSVDAMAGLLPRVTSPVLTKHDVYQLAPADLVELSTKVTDFLLPASAKADATQTA